ncbi:UNVERIFIED_CONTAM: hypothetical protein GTU68_000712 [Idotea baltica]|nr:hypothetical protein [Idotea baltica]
MLWFQLMPYNFEWTVLDANSGNDFGHAEEAQGNVVQGQYYVLLPDGRRQIVTYTVERRVRFRGRCPVRR